MPCGNHIHIQRYTLLIITVASTANLLSFQVDARTTQGTETSVDHVNQSAELKQTATAMEAVENKMASKKQ